MFLFGSNAAKPIDGARVSVAYLSDTIKGMRETYTRLYDGACLFVRNPKNSDREVLDYFRAMDRKILALLLSSQSGGMLANSQHMLNAFPFAANRRPSVMGFFLSNGLEPNIKTWKGSSLLSWSIRVMDEDFRDLFPAVEPWQRLQMARQMKASQAELDKAAECILQVIRAGASHSTRDEEGRTAMQYAIEARKNYGEVNPMYKAFTQLIGEMKMRERHSRPKEEAAALPKKKPQIKAKKKKGKK